MIIIGQIKPSKFYVPNQAIMSMVTTTHFFRAPFEIPAFIRLSLLNGVQDANEYSYHDISRSDPLPLVRENFFGTHQLGWKREKALDTVPR